jgi:hypothetical protein
MRFLTTIVLATTLYSGVASADNLSLKDFRELYDSLSTVTGIKPNADIQQTYADVRGTLPKTGDVSEYSAAMQAAMMRLSGQFCKAMIDSDAAISDPTKRRAHAAVDFTSGPKAMTSDIRKSVIAAYAALYWQRLATDTETTTLLTAMDGVAAGLDDSPTSTRQVLLLACTAASTSIDFLTM